MSIQSNKLRRFLTTALAALFFAAIVSLPHLAWAQTATSGLESIRDVAGFGMQDDPTVIIAKLIRTALTFLGVIAVVIVMYGGFVWMTAGGDASKVDRAKRTLINGGIGLTIILMSWAVTTFVISALLGATGGGGGGGAGGGAGGGGLGGGSSSTFEVTAQQPSGAVSIRNVAVQITFSRLLDANTVNDRSVTVASASGTEVVGSLTVRGNKVTFVPAAACPDPNADRFCFEANTEYTVTIDDTIDSSTGVGLSCANGKCVGTFTTGDLVDTEDPQADLTLPDAGAGISVDALAGVQAHGTDDAGVAGADFAAGDLLFDSVPASGADLTDVLIDSLWDTTGLQIGQRYSLSATVSDLAGNTDQDSTSVIVRSASCFNGVQDGAETGLDCGGDSSAPEYCGACDGSSCVENADCGGGLCLNGSCTTPPTINDVSPLDGAPGTYVTLTGQAFGSLDGTVSFTGSTGLIAASMPSCSSGWSTDQIVVQVPDGAIDGPIVLTTAAGLIEATDDTQGPLIVDFDVNNTEKPGLCNLSPDFGRSSSGLTVEGVNFGGSRGDSQILFGSTAGSSYNSWADSVVGVTVPELSGGSGDYAVTAVVNGVASNALNFNLLDDNAVTPVIASLDPVAGGVGQYVTVSGVGFGASVGTVWLENQQSGERALASLDFPSACTTSVWRDTQVTVIIPETLQTGGALPLGAYTLYLINSSGAESNRVAFEVTAAAPTPGLCAIEPATALPGASVTLFGDNFGTTPGSVAFFQGQAAAVTGWSDGEITATVPPAATTGPVVVSNATAAQSNAINFEVSGSTVVAVGSVAAYGWSFSSGVIPLTPDVVFACTDDQVSGVPNDDFTAGGVCVNADVYVEFTVDMNEATIDGNMHLEKCTAGGNNPCASTEEVFGTLTTTARSAMLALDQDLDISSQYRVRIESDVQSLDGVALGEDVTWGFTTRAEATGCSLERVIVSPRSATISELFGTKEYRALPVAGCMVLSGDDYSWLWSIDESYARFNIAADPSCSAGSSACANAEALAEGTTDVTAEERDSGIGDAGSLTINFADPYVINQWPNCEEACVNAEVGASFNTAMNEAVLEANGSVSLYRCTNELCSTLTQVSGATARCVTDANGRCTGFVLDALNLTPSTFYRVVVSGQVVSTSGVPLIRTNYGGDYSWVFRVREDASVCAVDRISIEPTDALVREIGGTQAYSAAAFGAADSCSVSGQRLSGFDYAWNWVDPILDEDIDNNPTTRVADWLSGSLVDTDPMSVAEGCTQSCVAAGSQPYAAICGDGFLDVASGEECEDGNVAGGDGCSASCLREGAGSFGSCGNGVVERMASGAGEDCDDGNVLSSDGCSSVCLAEGSGTVDATCGNGDVAVLTTSGLAGEECDDGNALRGDGCSAECLNEGSPTLASVGGAVCSNGVMEMPAENCDDGNTLSGDGCSLNCLLEGSAAVYGSVCGDGTIGVGEACDDSNATGGDGCTAKCLLEGSSLSYSTPSFCGDGVTGVGELAACEATASGDGQIDPLQVAQITDSAVFEVATNTQQATATIEVSEASSRLSTTANLRLSCTAENDLDCSDPEVFGVGEGNCCVERPSGQLYPNGANVCRNATLYGIFDREMDLQSLTYEQQVSGVAVTKYRMYAKLDLGSTSSAFCPADHMTLAGRPRSPLVRLWYKVRNILGRPAQAASGDCVAPITGFSQVAREDGTFEVRMTVDALLVANADYTLVVEGDTVIDDGVPDGVRSRFGASLNGNLIQDFSVGSEICAFDDVTISDTVQDSAFLFTAANETHVMVADAISHTTGIPQSIAPVPGVYDWEWTGWSTEDNGALFDVVQDSASPSQAALTVQNDNGESVVIATANITEDATGIGGATVINGSEAVTAFLCENPWPSLTSFPWTDSPASLADGAEQGAAWTNFSTMYCRDTGADGLADDLPALVVVRPPTTASVNVFKEYLFEIADSSGDAIGFRIVQNPGYLSPRAWYLAQGFVGQPKDVMVDGFTAVEDGRTTYAMATNQTTTGELYSNIYVISYNEGASQTTRDIYTELRDNLRFAIDVPSVGLCVAADGVTFVTDGQGQTVNCSSDAQCDSGAGASCADLKSKLRRDSKRLGDITDLAALVNAYKLENGVVPSLPAGSFVRGLSSSVWESWNSILGGALSSTTMPADPLNYYQQCGGGTLAAYDAETCVDGSSGKYICPAGSSAYHYQAIGESAARLFADLEYTTGSYVNPIDNNSSDAVTITIGNSAGAAAGFTAAAFCSGATVYGSSASCGDGVVGSSEVCEIGQLGGAATACTAASGLPGSRSQTCNSTCSGFVDDAAAACIVATCGDGVLNAGEECDDGSNNGAYGFCGQDCTYGTAFYCGDGLLAGGESCDCGAPGNGLSVSRAYQAGAGSCVGANGDYSASPNASCAWDCSGPAAYCGDGVVDGGEVCDGEDLTWAGKLCAQNSPVGFKNVPCSTNADCGGGVCGGNGTGNRAACPVGKTRVRTCDDAAGASCKYTVNNWFNIACTEIGSCGDGVVDPDEQCDDGNTDGTDSCTSSCQLNVCGDGSVFLGQEQCDEGINNGASCDSAYGSSCTACSLSCRYEVASGEFCGDGVRNGNEYCDAADIPYTYFDAPTDTTFGSCETLNTTVSSGGITYTCRNLGICNGGTAPGQLCTNNTGSIDQQGCPGGGTCVLPTCADNCASSCPLTTTSESLLVTANQPGSRPESSTGVFSYSADTTAVLPNAATITVPACSVATSFTADVSLANVEPPTTYVVFVTDESWTMKWEVNNDTDPEPGERSRLEVAVDSMETAFEDIFDGLGENVQIGSIGFKGLVKDECYVTTNACTTDTSCSSVTPGDFCNNDDSSLQTGVPFGNLFDFVSESGKSSLIAEIHGYFPDPKNIAFNGDYYGHGSGHGTFTYEALEEALELFAEQGGTQGTPNARYIAILLSDGEWFGYDPQIAADKFDLYGYELYTATLSKNNQHINNMEAWSSNLSGQGVGENGLDYSYVADTEVELEGMYEQIVESILSINVTLTTSTGGSPVQTSGNIREGANITLPFPDGFVCNPDAEQSVPLQFTFPGVGQLEVSNVRMNACTP